jgi:hypothetical protein
LKRLGLVHSGSADYSILFCVVYANSSGWTREENHELFCDK